MKISPGVLLIGLLLGTAYGPLAMLADVTPGDLGSQAYWLQVAAAAVRAFASSGLAVAGVVAAAIGWPLVRGAQRQAPPE